MKRIYFDYAATTPTHPDVVKEMLPFFEEKFGNPSSIHSFGQEAKKYLEKSREKVADLISAEPEEIIFTSGGTEADNLALIGVSESLKDKGNHIITSTIEHHAVLETCHHLEKRGFKITYLPVDKYGMVNPDDVKKAINKETILISIMHANNEIGTIEPIEEISKITREKEIYFHTDAVQTAGSIPTLVNKLNVDLLSISSHKIYGPKGVGALYLRKGTKIISCMYGGEQERKRRAGTENIPAIVGFGKACEITKKEMSERISHLTKLRDKLIKEVLENIEEVQLNGHPEKRLPNNTNFSIKYIEGESMLLNLDLKGIAASTGSACSSRSLEPSHVLLATGVNREQAYGSVRFSLGRENTEEDIDYLVQTLKEIVKKLRSMSPLYKGKK